MKKPNKRKVNLPKVNFLIAECNVHETEIMSKVKHALSLLLPQTFRSRLESKIYQETVVGHYKNTIWRLKLQIEKDIAQEATLYLFERLIHGEKDRILAEFNRRFDEKSLALYLRLNKQKLAQNEFWLTNGLDSVVICIKIKAQGPKRIIESRRFLKNLLQN